MTRFFPYEEGRPGIPLLVDTDEEPGAAKAAQHEREGWVVLAGMFALVVVLASFAAGAVFGQRQGYTHAWAEACAQPQIRCDGQ